MANKQDSAVPSGFGLCTFALPASDGVYNSKWEAGARSTKAIDCLVPMGNGLNVVTAIYANFKPTDGGHQITFSASLPKGLRAESKGAKNRFLAHVENAAIRWNGYQRATDAAAARFSDDKPATKAETRPDMSPRLVKAAANVKATIATVSARSRLRDAAKGTVVAANAPTAP